MIDKDFCSFLEYEICKAFQYSGNEDTKGFWCDGVLISESPNSYSEKFINDNKQTILKAFIGKDGQQEYELILKFGNKSLSKYRRGLDIKESLPQSNDTKWFSIDTEHKKIVIQLD